MNSAAFQIRAHLRAWWHGESHYYGDKFKRVNWQVPITIVRCDIDCNTSGRPTTVNKLRMRTSEKQGRKSIGVWWLSGLCIDDQIGQDRRLLIAENLAATGCSSKSSMCERASERTNEADKCLLSLHTRLRYLNVLQFRCCRRHRRVVVIYAGSVEKNANYALTLYNREI